MSTNLHPDVIAPLVKPEKKSDTEQALERATARPEPKPERGQAPDSGHNAERKPDDR